MNKLLEWVKQNKTCAIAIISLFVVLPPFAIYILYLFGWKEKNTPFSAESLLTYWGSVLTFLGTTFLGYWSLSQNDKFKQENDKSQDRLNKATEKLEQANEMIAQANNKQVEISSKLLQIQQEMAKPILNLKNGYLEPLSTGYNNGVCLNLVFKVIRGELVKLEYDYPDFDQNAIIYIPDEYLNDTNIKRKSIAADNEFKLKFSYTNLQFGFMSKHFSINVYTTDIYERTRKNIFKYNIVAMDKFEFDNYEINEAYSGGND